MNTLTTLWRDEGGFIISAELVLILTIGCIGMIVGLNSVATSVTNELNDISSALGAIDQSYAYYGLTKAGHAWVVGSGYADGADYCDCSIITQTHALIHGNASGYSEASGYAGGYAGAGAYAYAGASGVAVADAGAYAVAGAFAFGAGGCYAFAEDGTLVVVLADGRIINVTAAGVIITVSVDGIVLDAFGNTYGGTCYGLKEDGEVYVLSIVDGRVTTALIKGVVIAKVVNEQTLVGGYAVAVNGTLVRVFPTGLIINIRVDGTIVLVTAEGKITDMAGIVLDNPGTIYTISSAGRTEVFSLDGLNVVPPAREECDEEARANGECESESAPEAGPSKKEMKPVPQKKPSAK